MFRGHQRLSQRLCLVLCLGLFLAQGLVLPVLADQGTSYYVDSQTGADANSGLSPDRAWRTLGRVERQRLVPGDVVHLKSGSSWDGGLYLDRSGEAGRPVTYTTYGSGAKPIVRNPGDSDTWAKAIMVYANWVVIDGLAVRDVSEAGIYLASTSQHNIVRNCDITNVGIGVAVYGQYNLVSHNTIHDLRLVVNTPGGDDDYGAVGAWLFSSNNQVAYNTFDNCQAPSYDYGTDGGAIEFFGAVNNSYVHHNWAENCEGFLEVGGGDSHGRKAKDTRVAYNVLVDNTRALHFNLGAYQYASDVANFRFENNTVVESTQWETAINFIQGELTGNQLILRNNVFKGFYKLARKLDGGTETKSTGFIHEYNVYHGIGQSFALGAGELFADPRFTNLGGLDLTLQANSPAIDSGTDLGYALDFDENLVPCGAAPDRGAYEYRLAPTSTPTPTATALPATNTPTPTATALPPTATPTATATAVPPTNTPTATATSIPATVTPTATATELPATATPTGTATALPATATPTATVTAIPATGTPTGTATAVPATTTPTSTLTSVPPTSTPEPTPVSVKNRRPAPSYPRRRR